MDNNNIISQKDIFLQPDYIDEDLIVISDLKEALKGNDKTNNRCLNCLILIFCTSGEVKLKLNETPYTVHEGDTICFIHKDSISEVNTSDDFNAKVVSISFRIIEYIFHFDSDIMNTIININEHRVIKTKENFREIYENYYQLIDKRLKHDLSEQKYNKGAMYSIISALMYDFASSLDIDKNDYITNDGNTTNHSEKLFKQFIQLITGQEVKQRSVRYYADKMCISPKHLTSTVSKVSGKTASKWINMFVIKDIKMLLLNPNITIKEICYNLGFENMSFFAKYFKRHYGMSPSEYRKYIINKK